MYKYVAANCSPIGAAVVGTEVEREERITPATEHLDALAHHNERLSVAVSRLDSALLKIRGAQPRGTSSGSKDEQPTISAFFHTARRSVECQAQMLAALESLIESLEDCF